MFLLEGESNLEQLKAAGVINVIFTFEGTKVNGDVVTEDKRLSKQKNKLEKEYIKAADRQILWYF